MSATSGRCWYGQGSNSADRRMTVLDVLGELLERADAPDEEADHFLVDDLGEYPEEHLAALATIGLLVPGTPARTVLCPAPLTNSAFFKPMYFTNRGPTAPPFHTPLEWLILSIRGPIFLLRLAEYPSSSPQSAPTPPQRLPIGPLGHLEVSWNARFPVLFRRPGSKTPVFLALCQHPTRE